MDEFFSRAYANAYACEAWDAPVASGLTNNLKSVADILGSTYDFGLKGYNNTYGAVENFAGVAARHAIDSLPGMGIPSHTWNGRDAYRNDYTPVKRAGAALGDFGSVALAGVLAFAWTKSGFKVGNTTGMLQLAGRIGGSAILLAGAAAGVRKTIHNTFDDGHLGGIGLGAAAVGTMFTLRNVRPKSWLGIGAVAGAVLGAGFIGYQAASHIRFGKGNLGKPAASSSPRLDGNLLPVAAARGFFNHFLEEGPATPGVTFGKAWKEPDAFRKRYTEHEQYGGMAGDLGAAILGGTSGLVVVSRVLGRNPKPILHSRIAQLANEISIPGRVINRALDIGRTKELVTTDTADRIIGIAENAINRPSVGQQTAEQVIEKVDKHALNYKGKIPELLYLAGIGLAGWSIYDAWDHGENNKNGFMSGPLSAGITGGLIVGGAFAISRLVPGIKDMPGKTRWARSLLASTAVVAGINMMRSPIESFVDEALHMHKKHPVKSPFTAGAFAVGGAAGGALLGYKAANLLAFGGRGKMLGGAIGAVAGAFAGFGISPVLASK